MGKEARDIQAAPSTAPDARAESRFTLLKGGHAWVFRCAPGDERSVIGAARAISARPSSGLDRFDVAALALQVSSRPTARPPAPAG